MSARSSRPLLAAGLWIGLIYATIPFVRRVQEAFSARWPPALVGYAVILVVICAAVISVARLRRRELRIGWVDIAWLAAAATVAIVWTGRLMGQPEEAVHFIEYGVLGVLLYRTLAEHIPDWTVHVAAITAGIVVGTVDEFIQWLAPERFWDYRDIVLNGGAVALVQIAIWRLVRRPAKAVTWSSWQLVCRFAAIEVLLLTLCLAATPQRLARLADHIPVPRRLATGTDAICEYGYRYAVNHNTFCQSRLSIEDLKRFDRDRATEIAAELDASRDGDGRSRGTVSPVEDPFGYEMRIHLFARNRNLQRARGQEAGSPDHRRLMTTAWRQNLILETYFGNTLEKSSRRWGRNRRIEVESAQDPEALFVSRVASHLITRISEDLLRALMLALLAFLVACDFVTPRRPRPGSPPA